MILVELTLLRITPVDFCLFRFLRDVMPVDGRATNSESECFIIIAAEIDGGFGR